MRSWMLSEILMFGLMFFLLEMVVYVHDGVCEDIGCIVDDGDRILIFKNN